MDNHEMYGMDVECDRMIAEAERRRAAHERSSPLGLIARAGSGFLVGLSMGGLLLIVGPFYLARQCWREDAWFTEVL